MTILSKLECTDKYGLILKRDLAINLYTILSIQSFIHIYISPDNAKMKQHNPNMKIDINRSSAVQF